MIWSAEGRPHPAAIRVMESVLRRVRRGAAAAAAYRERWRHEVAVAIQRRKAAMMRAVLPQKTLRQQWVAEGGGRPEAPLPMLEEDCEGREGAQQD